jgi:hypothetical protein
MHLPSRSHTHTHTHTHCLSSATVGSSCLLPVLSNGNYSLLSNFLDKMWERKRHMILVTLDNNAWNVLIAFSISFFLPLLISPLTISFFLPYLSLCPLFSSLSRRSHQPRASYYAVISHRRLASVIALLPRPAPPSSHTPARPCTWRGILGPVVACKYRGRRREAISYDAFAW